MTFLNPMMLWGLAAISIPILIHIFNLRRTKKIEFSTLMFLKEIQQSKYRKIKLKQLLILLCRILMITFLVTAFAQPFETGYLGKPEEKIPSSVLILLDDSFSMQARDQHGQYFETAKMNAAELLDMLSDHDEIYFTTVSAIAERNTRPFIGERELLKDSVKNARISDVSKTLNEVMYSIGDVVQNFSKPNKEIYLITDAQRTFIADGAASFVFRDEEKVHFNIIAIGNRTGNNISLDTVNVITKIFEKNRDVRIRCIVNNRNNFNAAGKSVVLTFGSYREEKIVDVPSNSSVEVEFKFKPDTTGFSGGNIELTQSDISEDEIGKDNKRYFVIYVPEKIELLFLAASGYETEFVKLALNSYEAVIKDEEHSNTQFFNIKESESLSSENLATYDAIVVLNKPRFTDAEGEKLKGYVANGGGLIIFPGKNSDLGNYNELMKKLELSPINGTFGDLSGTQTFKFEKIDIEHPVLEGIYKETADTRKNFVQESPAVKFGWDLLSQKNSIPIIVLNNEKNFLVEYSYGNGKILFYAVPPDMSYSDFPAANLFSPLIVRSLLYPANKVLVKEAIVGRDYFLDIGAIGVKDSLFVGGKGFGIQGNEVINLKKALNYVSNYDVKTTPVSPLFKGDSIGTTVFEFPCNFDKKESDLQKMSGGEIKEMLQKSFGIGVNVIESDKELTASLTALRSGKEIWQYFLILALICIAIEYYLAKSLMK